MAVIETPPRVVTKIEVTCVQTMNGQQYGISVDRHILADSNGRTLPQPIQVQVHPCDQLFLLAEAIKHLSVQLGQAMTQSGPVKET
jgi:hypothetical protein